MSQPINEGLTLTYDDALDRYHDDFCTWLIDQYPIGNSDQLLRFIESDGYYFKMFLEAKLPDVYITD